jgi:hypothetical protein
MVEDTMNRRDPDPKELLFNFIIYQKEPCRIVLIISPELQTIHIPAL